MDQSTDIRPVILPDEQIIELYWQRDEKAIHETQVKYGRMLFRIAYNMLHDRFDCEECRNDTLLGIWNAIPPHKTGSVSGIYYQNHAQYSGKTISGKNKPKANSQ